jgi:hypothetical protein
MFPIYKVCSSLTINCFCNAKTRATFSLEIASTKRSLRADYELNGDFSGLILRRTGSQASRYDEEGVTELVYRIVQEADGGYCASVRLKASSRWLTRGTNSAETSLKS